MILSARAIASEMADSDAGEFSPVPLRQFSCCEDASRDQGHALSAFIHVGECNAFAFYSPQENLLFYHRLPDLHSRVRNA
jgi:hypothetical protein